MFGEEGGARVWKEAGSELPCSCLTLLGRRIFPKCFPQTKPCEPGSVESCTCLFHCPPPIVSSPIGPCVCSLLLCCAPAITPHVTPPLFAAKVFAAERTRAPSEAPTPTPTPLPTRKPSSEPTQATVMPNAGSTDSDSGGSGGAEAASSTLVAVVVAVLGVGLLCLGGAVYATRAKRGGADKYVDWSALGSGADNGPIGGGDLELGRLNQGPSVGQSAAVARSQCSVLDSGRQQVT